ncbi:MAG: OmpH family outer membrane protein [Planctomycetota bacterium]|nr:OmpH family outer membrane protein [Planctomycetota bacterium]
MHPRERIMIYGLLALLIALNVSLLLGRGGSPAFADPQTGPGDPGPVELLTLRGDAEDIALRNRGGRLAWGESAHDRAYSVGYVYTGKILGQLMQSEAFAEEREPLMEEVRETEAEYRQRLDEIQKRLRELDPNSEEAQAALRQGQAVYEEFMQWQESALGRRGRLDADQLERAYRELVAAVEIVADRNGIDTIYQFVPTGEPFEAENPEQAMTAIRLRSALRYPEALDITADVMEELHLEEE